MALHGRRNRHGTADAGADDVGPDLQQLRLQDPAGLVERRVERGYVGIEGKPYGGGQGAAAAASLPDQAVRAAHPHAGAHVGPVQEHDAGSFRVAVFRDEMDDIVRKSFIRLLIAGDDMRDAVEMDGRKAGGPGSAVLLSRAYACEKPHHMP